ncbi:hypothetical protein [Myxosarcina sp. GI1]|uniref:hypothetical protein n=1 Tax=Myxosarcina sp. GI1 TaxID=1541065 RepID=UPI0006909A24|nr:hypothetical protein [Myxosarcina sp. GI1]
MKATIFKTKIVWITGIFAIFAINCMGYLSAYFLTNYRQTDKQFGYPRPVNKQTPKDFQLQYISDRLKTNQQ